MGGDAKRPSICFAEFTDAWEQRKLREISDKVIEKNTLGADRETFTNSAEFGIISQRDYFDHDISNVENLGNYYMVRNDDFVYNPRISTTAPVGPINRNKLGRIGVMSPLYTVFRTHDIDRTYLEYFFKSYYWHSYMEFHGDSGARSDRFSIKDSVFIEMPIPYPKIEEQKKIGNYLTQLDTLITLHQRKYDKLVNLKKSMLEKMFPQHGTDVPEIRFAGFTDAWEKRLYCDVIDLLSGQDFTPSNYNENGHGIPYMTGASCIVGDRTIVNRWTRTPRCIANEGDLLLVCKGSGYGAITTLTQKKAHIARQFMALRPRLEFINPIFNYYLASSIVHNIKMNARGLIVGIARDAVLKQKIIIPALDEQEKIGRFFCKLDRLISLYQHKLIKLQNIKKSCLEKMFI